MATTNRAAANKATDVSAFPNMEDLIAQVFEKQISVLESVIYNAVKGALMEMNALLQHTRAELETEGTTVCDMMHRESEEAQHEIHAMSTLLIHPDTRGVTHGGREFAFTAATDANIFCQELDMEDDATSTQTAPLPTAKPEDGRGTRLVLEPVL